MKRHRIGWNRIERRESQVAIGTMLACCSEVPSAGQKPASSGNTRMHLGQLFMVGEWRVEE